MQFKLLAVEFIKILYEYYFPKSVHYLVFLRNDCIYAYIKQNGAYFALTVPVQLSQHFPQPQSICSLTFAVKPASKCQKTSLLSHILVCRPRSPPGEKNLISWPDCVL